MSLYVLYSCSSSEERTIQIFFLFFFTRVANVKHGVVEIYEGTVVDVGSIMFHTIHKLLLRQDAAVTRKQVIELITCIKGKKGQLSSPSGCWARPSNCRRG